MFKQVLYIIIHLFNHINSMLFCGIVETLMQVHDRHTYIHYIRLYMYVIYNSGNICVLIIMYMHVQLSSSYSWFCSCLLVVYEVLETMKAEEKTEEFMGTFHNRPVAAALYKKVTTPTCTN